MYRSVCGTLEHGPADVPATWGWAPSSPSLRAGGRFLPPLPAGGSGGAAAGQSHFCCLKRLRSRRASGLLLVTQQAHRIARHPPAIAGPSARTEAGGADGPGLGKAAPGARAQRPGPCRGPSPTPGFRGAATGLLPPPPIPGPAAASGADPPRRARRRWPAPGARLPPRRPGLGRGGLPGLSRFPSRPLTDGRAVRRHRRPLAPPGPLRKATVADPNGPRVTSTQAHRPDA